MVENLSCLCQRLRFIELAEFCLSSDIDEIISRIGESCEMLSGKTILLTGGRGFLGRYFVEVFNHISKNLTKKPIKLIVLDNLITAGKEDHKTSESNNIKFIEHDVIQFFNYDEKIDLIIHAAGIASPHHYRNYPLETIEVAITGTQNMLELAKKSGSHFIFFSSSEIYGDPDKRNVPIKETYRGNVSCQGPRACYDEGKRVGETLCYIFKNLHNIKTNIIRPFNIYGPGMLENDYRVLANFARKIKSGKPLNIYGDGKQTRTFCYITDALVGFLLVMLRGAAGETYNIGNPTPEISMIQLTKLLKHILKKNIEYDFVDYPSSYPADEPLRRCPNIEKAALNLGFKPIVGLEEGLGRFISWTDKIYTGE